MFKGDYMKNLAIALVLSLAIMGGTASATSYKTVGGGSVQLTSEQQAWLDSYNPGGYGVWVNYKGEVKYNPGGVIVNTGMQPFGDRVEDDYTATMAIQPADYSKQTTLNGLFIQDATIKLQGE